ncbi:MAG TPA: histone deacetylase family protein [Anaeromyxobacteraceae bacterium]|nr:histone deacetylase family protein [Anaeromyxobacteraceae bacterium]
MRVVLNDRHVQHHPAVESFRGRTVPAFETPARVAGVLAALEGTRHAPALAPDDHGLAPIEAVHRAPYLRFLRSAHEEWRAAGGEGDAFPAVWPVRSLRSDVEPRSLAGRLGLYSMDAGTPLTAGSFTAAYWGAQATLTALDRVRSGEPAAYALTRPPGHHAGADFFGGYCFLNNAAITAAAALSAGAARVAILDVDYHHGNGTQAIFYDRRDVLYVSVHGDPSTEYPFFLGHADERGEGAGLGFNLNLPLPAGASAARWFEALGEALGRVRAHAPQLLVVSLGVDTSADDPICTFQLQRDDFARLGSELAAGGWPTLVVQEGGYATEVMGANVVAVLDAFSR